MLAQTEWKEKPVTLRVSNQPLGKVLEMVAEAAGAKITLQEVSLWNINKPTSIVVKDKPLDKVLGELIGDQNIVIRYEDGNHIVVLPDTQYATEKVELNVTGQVFDKDTGEPLIGATVLITDGTGKDKGARGCITDIDGKFSIRLAKKESISVSYMGYETVSKQMVKEEHNLVIELKPSIELDDVVVDPAFAIGYIAQQRIGAGMVIKESALRDPDSIVRGQPVRTEARGVGFVATGEGVALESGAPGSVIQVRTSSGQVVTGTVINNTTVRIMM